MLWLPPLGPVLRPLQGDPGSAEETPRAEDYPVGPGMRRVYCGVDPGFTGALCFWEVVDGKSGPVRVYEMPVYRPVLRRGQGKQRIHASDVARIVAEEGRGDPIFAVVEKVGAMGGKKNRDGSVRKEGASSQFRFGQGQGEVCGVLVMYNYLIGGKTWEVPPQVWKLKAGLIGVSEKVTCKRAAKLAPRVKMFGPRGGALHGRAESVFLARHARWLVQGRV